MIWLLIIPCVCSALFLLLQVVGYRAARSARTTTPTELKIDAQAQSEHDKVEHASGQDLADQFSDRMLKR